tara:strand:- start:121 stop:1176 length:1056 start_codon:yes stop_codon:yes gene_type:complete
MEYIVNHNRFKKLFNENEKELNRYLAKKNRIVKFPQYDKNYFNFFNNYAKKNYVLIANNCLCGSSNDILLSQTDRHCVDFKVVVCKSCGLIRAKNYYRNKDVEDFYSNYYRSESFSDNFKIITPEQLFKNQKKESFYKFNLLNKYKNQELKNLKIIDLGGGAGGALDHFDDSNQKYLFDYSDPLLTYAETKGIISIKGGLDKVDFKPDIIILSHVIEHWNNFDYEMKKLINIQIKNQTLNYIEFPGVDSLKDGRREGDILGDIHVPHVYYFTSYVFENIMNRYGFEKVYLDSLISSIFVYTGDKSTLINYYHKCSEDLIAAEKFRKFQIFKKLIKKIIPSFIVKIIKKMRE